jgi:hypothetical protein
MRSLLLLIALTCLAHPIFSQYVYTLRADTVKITSCDSAELVLQNHTQGVPGFLFNAGNGRTVFQRGAQSIGNGSYLVGADTIKTSNNAWLQGGNAFGATGVLGTLDNNPLDFYTNNTQVARLDNQGNFLLGTTTTSNYKLDVAGYARVSGDMYVSAGDSYTILMAPSNNEYPGANGSSIFFGAIYASIGVIKSPVGLIPANSMVIGGTSPNTETTIVDYNDDPVFVVGGSGNATINGGYSGVYQGGSLGAGNSNAYDFVINGCRGTGAGLPGDILFATGTSQDSGAGIHPMTTRWLIKGGTGNLSNTSTPTSSLDITGATGYSQFRLRTSYTPTSTSDTNGNTGDFSWDDNYFYIKTSSGWKRSALTTF